VGKKSVVLLLAGAVVHPVGRLSVVLPSLLLARALAAMIVAAAVSMFVQRLKVTTVRPVRSLQFVVSAIASVARQSSSVCVLIRFALCGT